MTIQKIQTGVIEDNAITTSKVLDGSVTPEKLATSGTLPALDGSQLINIQAGTTEIIDDTVDPAIDTNPADGVGTLWANTTTGCLFCCTDATTDLNIWTMITVCNDNIGTVSSTPFNGNAWMMGADLAGTQQGSLLYYNLSSGNHQIISSARPNGTWGGFGGFNQFGSTDSVSSVTQAYVYSVHLGGTVGIRDVLERFTFASATTATDHDSLWTHFPVGSSDRGEDFFSGGSSGVSSISFNRGYVSGGANHTNTTRVTTIRSIQLDSGVVNIQVGDLPTPVYVHAGVSNENQALFAGGRLNGGVSTSHIHRFNFSNESVDNNHSDIGIGREGCTGHSTETDGFIVGGGSGVNDGPVTISNTILKTSFASSGASIDHGDLIIGVRTAGRAQNITHGFTVGGSGLPLEGQQTSIQRYAFANNVTAQEISNLGISSTNGTSCSPRNSFTDGSESSSSGDAWLFGGSEGIAAPNHTSTNELTYISLTSDSQQNVGSGDVNGPTPFISVSCNSATTSYIMGVHTGASILDSTVKFTFANATNSASPTSVSDTGQGSGGAFISSVVNSMSTDVNGYVGGGRDNVGIALQSRAIRRISFASEAVTSNIGTISSTVFGLRAAQNSIGGLFMGGRFTNGNNDGQNRVTNIDKFTFASETNQVNFDNLNTATEGGTATSSDTHAYLYGGVSGNAQTSSPPITIMSKIAFASAGSEVSHGDLRVTITGDRPAQTLTHGYSIGGNSGSLQVSSITQYSFANENSAVLATNMTRARDGGSTVSQVPTITSF